MHRLLPALAGGEVRREPSELPAAHTPVSAKESLMVDQIFHTPVSESSRKIAAMLDSLTPVERLETAEYLDWRQRFIASLDEGEKVRLLWDCGFRFETNRGWVER